MWSASGCGSTSRRSGRLASSDVEFVVLGVVLALFVIAGVVAFLKAPSRQELPPLLDVGKDHQAACWLAPL